MHRTFTALGALAAVVLVLSCAAPAAAQVSPALDKDWTGPLIVGSGQRIEVTFKLRQVLGEARGTLEIPAQNVAGAAFTEVVTEGDKVRLRLAALGLSIEATVSPDGARLEGALMQAGATLPIAFTAHPANPRPQTPRAAPPYRQEAVTYVSRSSGLRLTGVLSLPQGPGPHPAVVLITGSGSQDRDETVFDHRPFAVIADRLTREGVAVLRVDDRGVGGSDRGQPNATMADFVTDVRAGVAFLRTRPEIDGGRIGLIGHSEGADIAAEIGANDQKIAFIVMLAGVGLRGDQSLLLQTAAIARAAGASAAQVEEGARFNRAVYAAAMAAPNQAAAATAITAAARDQGWTPTDAASTAANMSADYMRYLLRYDPAPVLAQLTMPVLALDGGKDLQVLARENLAAIKAANAKIETAELPGLNHLFQTAPTGQVAEYIQIEETFAPAALDRIAAWVTNRVKR